MQDEKPFAFVVYGQPATKKNSAVMVARRATLLPSKAYRAYEKVFRAAMRELKARLGDLPHYDGPVQLTAKYYLESRAHYPDLNGLLQATQDNIPMQTILMELFRRRPRNLGEAEKEKCHSDATEPPVTPFKCKTGISYSVDKSKPLRSDSSAKSAKPYPQDAEDDEYRYIDAGWLEAVARGLTAGAEKHPGETWRQIPPEEHAARAMRHLNLYRAGDCKDTHLINAAMRCMMAYATEKARGEGRA